MGINRNVYRNHLTITDLFGVMGWVSFPGALGQRLIGRIS
jgi:hypothetical protein